MEAGFRCIRITTSGTDSNGRYNSRQAIPRTYELCQQAREGVGKEGDWAIDFHTDLDMPDAVALAKLIEPLHPYFVEDPIRSENLDVYEVLRSQIKVPIAMGEQLGTRWNVSRLMQNHLIDYTRQMLPNCGGITEFMKIAVYCGTNYIGMIPHFTGPVSEAATVHCLMAFTGPAMSEFAGATAGKELSYLPQSYDFRNGKMWPNSRPGLGVEFNPKYTRQVSEITEHFVPWPLSQRPDGSLTQR